MPPDATIEPVPREAWVAVAARFRDHGYQQTWGYAHALAARQGAACEHVAIRAGTDLLGAASVRIRSLPVVGGGIAYVSGGPLSRLDRDDDHERLAACLDALHTEYVARRGLVLRVLGPIGPPDWNERAAAVFVAAGLAPTSRSRGYRTLVVDMTPAPAEILARCSKYWRRNLRRAERAAFSVRTGEAPALFNTVRELYAQLRDRKIFDVTLDADFYADLQPRLDAGERFVASVVEGRDGPVAGLVSSRLGDTCVPLVLAADIAGLRSYAVYHLQWASILHARAGGMRFYDLGGIDPDANPGVFNFKNGLRGNDVRAPGPFEATPTTMTGLLTRGAERVYRHMKRAA